MEARRPLKTRSRAWAMALANWLAARSVTPNQISLLSIVFAAIGSYSLIAAESSVWLVLTALCVQLRLLANMLDGLVAVEAGKATATGVLYNEVPDRIADTLFLLALGAFCDLFWLGCLAALVAIATAYIRLLGGSLGLPQSFRGPMAKQHRMFALTLGLLLQAAEWELVAPSSYAALGTLLLITFGSLLTCCVRLQAIARALEKKGSL